jgi:3-hydroxyacyl-[acyl-carrier-protein] dehydratase
MMRFQQIDAIRQLEPFQRVVAVKNLSMAEEYLQDHFPRFPVMPGVVMLETLYQAAAWLVRASEDFAHSMVVLREAKNVKFADLVRPGDQLMVHCETHERDARCWTFKAEGTVHGRTAVRARLVLERYNLADEHPNRSVLDDHHVIAQLREQFARIAPADFVPTTAR